MPQKSKNSEHDENDTERYGLEAQKKKSTKKRPPVLQSNNTCKPSNKKTKIIYNNKEETVLNGHQLLKNRKNLLSSVIL